MVGSADFDNKDIQGEVNMATSQTRQPGSSIKPFTYLAAFEKGWTPATLIWDVPSEFPPSGDPIDPREPYKPVNYDGRFHGPVTVRTALANSYNVPAVKTLQFAGIYDNPSTPQKEGLIGMASKPGDHLVNAQRLRDVVDAGWGRGKLVRNDRRLRSDGERGLALPAVCDQQDRGPDRQGGV